MILFHPIVSFSAAGLILKQSDDTIVSSLCWACQFAKRQEVILVKKVRRKNKWKVVLIAAGILTALIVAGIFIFL